MLAKVICKAVDYSFIIQDEKIVILNIPPSRKALPEDLHIRARNKKMVDGVTACDFFSFAESFFVESSRAKQLTRSMRKTASCKKAPTESSGWTPSLIGQISISGTEFEHI